MSNRKPPPPPPPPPNDAAARGASQSSSEGRDASSDDMPMFALAGPGPRLSGWEDHRKIESIVERIQVGDTAEGVDAIEELIEIVQGRAGTLPIQRARQYLTELDTRQGSYLAASGTLTQFNAILAAVCGAALSTVELGVLKVSMAAALLSHIAAAFFLCWAARPVAAAAGKSLLDGMHALIDDTFRNYQRG